MSEKRHRDRGADTWIGVGLTLLLHVIAAGVSLLIIQDLSPFLMIGVAQLVYIVPASLIFMKKAPGISAGLWIGAGITFLLNAACFGIGFGLFFINGG